MVLPLGSSSSQAHMAQGTSQEVVSILQLHLALMCQVLIRDLVGHLFTCWSKFLGLHVLQASTALSGHKSTKASVTKSSPLSAVSPVSSWVHSSWCLLLVSTLLTSRQPEL